MQSIVLQDTLTLLEEVEGVTSRGGPVGAVILWIICCNSHLLLTRTQCQESHAALFHRGCRKTSKISSDSDCVTAELLKTSECGGGDTG